MKVTDPTPPFGHPSLMGGERLRHHAPKLSQSYSTILKCHSAKLKCHFTILKRHSAKLKCRFIHPLHPCNIHPLHPLHPFTDEGARV